VPKIDGSSFLEACMRESARVRRAGRNERGVTVADDVAHTALMMRVAFASGAQKVSHRSFA